MSSAEFELGLRLINQHKAIRGEPSQRAIYRGGVSKRNMSTGGWAGSVAMVFHATGKVDAQQCGALVHNSIEG